MPLPIGLLIHIRHLTCLLITTWFIRFFYCDGRGNELGGDRFQAKRKIIFCFCIKLIFQGLPKILSIFFIIFLFSSYIFFICSNIYFLHILCFLVALYLSMRWFLFFFPNDIFKRAWKRKEKIFPAQPYFQVNDIYIFRGKDTRRNSL